MLLLRKNQKKNPISSYTFLSHKTICILTHNLFKKQKIGDRAICSCKRLTTINLPESLSTIGKEVFDFCDSLSAIYIRNGTKNHFKELLTKDLHDKLIEVV